MQFEWDENKNKLNIKKHNIDFSDVPEMFKHPMLVSYDHREGYGEERWIGIGMLKIIVVVVVFIEPDSDTIRIISARKATKYESKKYEESIQNKL